MVAVPIKGFKKMMKFRRAAWQRNFQKRSSDIEKGRYKRKDNNNGEKGKIDLSKVKCYKCEKCVTL